MPQKVISSHGVNLFKKEVTQEMKYIGDGSKTPDQEISAHGGNTIEGKFLKKSKEMPAGGDSSRALDQEIPVQDLKNTFEGDIIPEYKKTTRGGDSLRAPDEISEEDGEINFEGDVNQESEEASAGNNPNKPITNMPPDNGRTDPTPNPKEKPNPTGLP